jgi:CubicO group peptidase (beta-lactamase class C family)
MEGSLMRKILLLIVMLVSSVLKAENKGLTTRIDAYIAPFLAGNNFSGCILIARNWKPEVNKCYGLANQEVRVVNVPETRFHIASISKPFTAAAILLLEERGQLSIENPLQRFFPGYPNGDKITLRHLLTHTSGIPNINDFPEYKQLQARHHSLDELIAMFRDRPLDFPAGSKYAYSNSNYNLLARIIELVSKKNYGDFLRENIFSPLHMLSSGHDDDAQTLIPIRAAGYTPMGATAIGNAPFLDWSNKTGNGSLYMTTADLLRFMNAYCDGKVVKKSTLDKIWIEKPGNNFGWFVRRHFGKRVIATNGLSPGFSSSMEFFPDDSVVVIVLSNLYITTTQAPIAPDLAAMAMNERLAGGDTIEPIKLALDKTKAFAGAYQFGPDFFRPNQKLTVIAYGDRLDLDWGNDFHTDAFAVGENEFIIRTFWTHIVFRGGQMTYKDNPKEYVAKRIAD